MTRLGEYQPRAVVKFVAEGHVQRAINAPGEFNEFNIVGAFNILEAVREFWDDLSEAEESAFRFLHVSTVEVYGSLAIGDPTFTERQLYESNSPSCARLAAHLLPAGAHH